MRATAVLQAFIHGEIRVVDDPSKVERGVEGVDWVSAGRNWAE